MKEYFPFLTRVPLFEGIGQEELPRMLGCLNAGTAVYRKGEIILREGEPVRRVGVVVSGQVQVVKEDFSGNRNILAEIVPGGLFAESYACVHSVSLPVTVVSAAESVILWLDYTGIVSPCASACGFHTRLVENMMSVLASKNILLSRKIEHISKRTTREKLLAYLSDQAAEQGSREFEIAFNRQELADYLCVDRSAMSGELGKMQREGILSFHSNHFRLRASERR